jgi:hypothetical protein
MWPGKNHFLALSKTREPLRLKAGGAFNYIMLDHPELQEKKDRARSIADLYEMQVKDGVDILDLTLLNTKRGTMGLMMDMFHYHKFEEKAIGQLINAQEKEKRCLT